MEKTGFWRKRRGAIPFIVIATVIVAVLFLNEETSVQTNMKYDSLIGDLKSEIQMNKDSAAYYKARRKAIEDGESDLEHLAREQYHMQKPTEDIYIYE